MKIVESLRAKQRLKNTFSETVDACSAEIQDAQSHMNLWQVEKRFNHLVAKDKATRAYDTLVAQYHTEPDSRPARMGAGDNGKNDQDNSNVEDTETEYHQTTAELTTAVITKGAKVQGGYGIALISNILSLITKLPIWIC